MTSYKLLSIFSQSFGSILIKLGMHDHWDKGFESYKYFGAGPLRKSSPLKIQCLQLNWLDNQSPQEMYHKSCTEID